MNLDEQEVHGLTPTELEFLQNNAALARIDPWYWLSGFVYTKDEHDKTILYKPFPVKLVYRVLCRVWREINSFYLDKSRQMLISWFFTAMYEHDALFSNSRLIFLQSKKQEDANALLERARHIYEGVMKFSVPILGQWIPTVKLNGNRYGTDDELEFIETKSKLQAIPQGPDIVRSYTLSGLFADEMNEQAKFADGAAAAAPSITGGGRFTPVGTPKGHTHAWAVLHGIDPKKRKKIGPHIFDSRLLRKKRYEPPANLSDEDKRYWIEKKLLSLSDEEFDAIPLIELIVNVPGMAYWRTAAGIDCIRVHYSADPDKDPVTKIGAAWKKEAYKMMNNPALWEREMELNYDTNDGRPVVSNWDRMKFVRPCRYDPNYPIILSFDFGTIKNITTFSQFVYEPELKGNRLKFLQEIILDNSNTVDQAKETVRMLQTYFRPAWETNDILAYCDPNGDREEGTTSDKSMNTHIKILNAVGIWPSNRKFGVPESTELIETIFSLFLNNDINEPVVLFDPACEYMISCFAGGLCYPDLGKGREGYYVKDGIYDHGGDNFRYVGGNTFTNWDLSGQEEPEYMPSKPIRDPYSARIIARQSKSSRRIPMADQRRGEHAIHR